MRILKTISAIFFILMSFFAKGQTSVSGGIYANTTWTLANSPYIVVDTVVVFPNVTLTIQPGVIVKFNDNKRIEFRQSKIIAQGTINDSITFTSNSSSPGPSIWSGLYLNQSHYSKFDYCNVLYADKGIYTDYMQDTVTIKHSNFLYNNIGLGYIYYTDVFVDSCNFKYNNYGAKWATGRVIMKNSNVIRNQYGIFDIERSSYLNCVIDSNTIIGISTDQNDTIIGCQIKNNGIGIDIESGGGLGTFITQNIIENNNIGIQLSLINTEQIFCNRICGNTSFDLKSMVSTNTDCVVGNYWCSTDSATISMHIYDGYDNINLGLVTFMPIDTNSCYSSGNCSSYFTLTPDITPYNYTAINMSIGMGAIEYTWDWGDGNYDYTAYPSHIYADTGTYTICLSVNDSAGCSSTYCNTFSFKTDAQMVYVNVIATGMRDDNIKEKEILIYPNPADDYIRLQLNNKQNAIAIKLINALGQIVIDSKPVNENIIINISNIPVGFYHLAIEDKIGNTYVQKLVINR